MIVAVLNGWGSSSRRRETRTAALVREATDEMAKEFLAKRAMLIWARARRFKRYILANQDRSQTLLCVGKSLGGRNMVTRILNELPTFLNYKRIGLMTIDPCWPLRWNWKPNLNRHILHLTHHVDRAVNVYAALPASEQAGAMLSGPNVTNIPLTDVDHYSIVQAEEVAEELGNLVDFLRE